MNIFEENGLLREEILIKIRGERKYADRLSPYTGAKRKKTKAAAGGDTSPAFIFEVDGFAPELLRDVAWRREKHYDTRGMKVLKCPYCGGKFEAVGNSVHVTIRCIGRKGAQPLHHISTCKTCRGKVGIIYSQSA